jgi:hypothetical protein
MKSPMGNRLVFRLYIFSLSGERINVGNLSPEELAPIHLF